MTTEQVRDRIDHQHDEEDARVIDQLGLAVKRGGRLATFDTGIDPSWVPGGAAALYLIPTE